MYRISEATSHILTTIGTLLLSGFLAFSGYVNSTLVHVLGGIHMTYSPTLQYPSDTPITEASPASAPSTYEIGGPIPRILLENASMQHAAIVESQLRPLSATSTSERVTSALVNIFCTYRENKRMHATTGSGVFIDSRGVILTNAHVAQFLLLTETREGAQCTVRQGTPAVARYTADLLYISPEWIHINAALIDVEAPTGTGERDYALLFVNSALSGVMPTSFPALNFNAAFLKKENMGDAVLAAGYPAKIFGTEGPRAELTPRVAPTSISNIYTFKKGGADVLALGNSVVGEVGSSGGPVVSASGELIGLIVTKGSVKDGPRSLRAITVAYINQTIQEETGFDLRTTLEGNIVRRSSIFKQALLPFLSSLLHTELN